MQGPNTNSDENLLPLDKDEAFVTPLGGGPSPTWPEVQINPSPTPSSDPDTQSSWTKTAERMRILMVDKATPLVLVGSEIIGSAWERFGGEKMIQVDYLKLNIGETQVPVPVLVPVNFFGGEIANVKKYISAQYEALSLIIEEKVRLVHFEKDRLPSYLCLEEFNLENARELCRQLIAAAQCFVECKQNQTTENIDWIRQYVSDSIRNQYRNWKLMGSKSTQE